jgi:hypothetical protein
MLMKDECERMYEKEERVAMNWIGNSGRTVADIWGFFLMGRHR